MAFVQKKASLSSNMQKVCALPDEIIEEILLRLSAKPLLRFRYVSKAWYQLISSSRFTKEHFKDGRLKIMFQVRTQRVNNSQYHKYPVVDYDALDEDVEMPDEAFNDMTFRRLVYNSCHGLLLLERWPRDGSVYVWNPTTGQRHLLTNPKLTFETGHDFDYGIGYDPIAKVYKVLFYNYDPNQHRVECSLYNLSTNSWKELEDIPYMHICATIFIFLENAFHFLACPLTSTSDTDKLIIAIDISNGMFREIPLPNYGDSKSSVNMGVSHSCLCLVTNLRGQVVNVWVMKEYGNYESWTKMFSINPEVLAGHPLPIHLSESGELLLYDVRLSPTIVHYDSITKNWKTYTPLIGGYIHVCIYVESLVRFDIAGNLGEENREIKRRFREERCFQVANFSSPCDLSSLRENANIL